MYGALSWERPHEDNLCLMIKRGMRCCGTLQHSKSKVCTPADDLVYMIYISVHVYVQAVLTLVILVRHLAASRRLMHRARQQTDVDWDGKYKIKDEKK